MTIKHHDDQEPDENLGSTIMCRIRSMRAASIVDSFRQSRVDSEASTFQIGNEPMSKLTVWRLFPASQRAAAPNKKHEKQRMKHRPRPRFDARVLAAAGPEHQPGQGVVSRQRAVIAIEP
jgi:hypothetical protein